MQLSEGSTVPDLTALDPGHLVGVLCCAVQDEAHFTRRLRFATGAAARRCLVDQLRESERAKQLAAAEVFRRLGR